MLETLLVLIFLALTTVASAVIYTISVLVRRIDILGLELEDVRLSESQRLLENVQLRQTNRRLVQGLDDAHLCLEMVLNDKETAS